MGIFELLEVLSLAIVLGWAGFMMFIFVRVFFQVLFSEGKLSGIAGLVMLAWISCWLIGKVL